MKKIVNGIEVDLTKEDIAASNALQHAWVAEAQTRMIKEFTTHLEQIINEKANEKLYSSGVSCASYVNSTNPQWSAEATSFIAWRDNAYAYAYDYLAKVQTGEIKNSNIEDFIAGIPAMVWPDVA